MKFGGVLLIVKDINKSKKFYEDVMEQNVTLDLGEHVSFENGFGLQINYKSIIGYELPINQQSNSFQLYFEVDDIKQWESKVNRIENIEFLHPIKEYSWGQRTFRFYDFDKNIIEVSENMESVIKRFLKQDLSIEEISKRTMYPAEFIKQFQ
ncbi:glyoxalase/bleomycin resistance/dioxygenase family protein [Clostridioides difficile]|nr:glyoxalase/bleomycin resistance/dioxygenase family protein [Clostridioides difficile]